MIKSIQYNPSYGEAGFLTESGNWVKIVLQDTLKAKLDGIVKEMETMQTQEEKQLDELRERTGELQDRADKAEEKARIAEENLKRAQDQIAKLVTGDSNATMTPETAGLFAELHDGISIDAGDYYRMPGGLVLYRAKCDMSPYVASEMSPKGKNGSNYWTGGGNDKQPAPKPGVKYPKGTEVNYMGARYYATKDTNDDPSVGYPTWDLAENKPQN